MREEHMAPQWQDACELTVKAQALLGYGHDGGQEPTATEDALRHAYRRMAADLEQIERKTNAGVPIDYAAILGTQAQEKIASFLLLAKYTLLDLAHFPREVLDIELAHRHLALFAEILFRTEAVDGLILVYDFAQSQMKARANNPQLWMNVCEHSLMLLALLERHRPRVVAFLAERPAACKQLQSLVSFTRPDVINRLWHEAAQLRKTRAAAPYDPPAYIKLYEHYDPALPFDSALGACSFIFAQHHVVRLLDGGDPAAALRWLVEGSPLTAREVLRHARAIMPARAYRHFLEAALQQTRMHPVRLAAIVLELGTLNRAERPDGGAAETNRLLFETAMSDKKEYLGVARVAVHELQAVRNIDALLVIAEHTPFLRVAEEAVNAMKALRRLLMVEPLLAARPKLEPAYRRAQAELLEIENIMDAVWTCDDPRTVQRHVSRLQELGAEPELEKIADLAERKGDLHRLHLAAADLTRTELVPPGPTATDLIAPLPRRIPFAG